MAYGINRAILIGYLGADPEIKGLENGTSLARINLATTESYKNKNGERVNETEWHTITFWNKLAEIVEKYVKKGDMIYVEGRIRTRKWEDKEGITRYSTEIIATNMTMLGGKRTNNTENNPTTTAQEQASTENTQQEPTANTPPADDDLPF